MQSCQIEELGHTSEIGLRIRAATALSLFACAGKAMFQLLGVETTNQPASQQRVTIRAFDIESLMVDWLSELLYLCETSHTIVTDCHVDKWAPTLLEATITIAAPVGTPSMHLKAVTYHQLIVKQDEDGWLGQVFFDI